VPRRAADDQLAPVGALLADDDGKLDAAGRGHRDAPGLGDDVVGPHGVGGVAGEPRRAVGPEGLLVGDGQVDEGASRPPARESQVLDGHGHGRGEVEHVHRAPAPHLAVDQLGPERIPLPAIGIRGHHVGVAHEHEGRGGRIGSLYPGHQRAAPRLRLVRLEVEALALELRAQQVDAARLLTRRGGAVVDAGVADQSLQEVGDLGGRVARGGAGHTWMLRGSRGCRLRDG
jgi:hypothetical protein